MPEVMPDDTPMAYYLDIRVGFNPETKGVTFGSNGEEITSQFETTDCIYVYNETKGAFARTPESPTSAPLTALHPSNISGNLCDLQGSLSFYVWDSGSNMWTIVSVDEDDTYSFFYQMNLPSPGSSQFPLFDYSDQDGSAASASAHDFAAQTNVGMTLSAGSLTLPDGILLKNLQSMFRLRLSFTDGDAAMSPAPSISGLTVGTKNGTLVYWYLPTKTGEEYDIDSIPLDTTVVISESNDIYLSLAFLYDDGHLAEGDELILTAKDSDNNIYQGTIPTPSGGFVNSKYFYGDLAMAKQIEEPSFSVSKKVGDVVTRLGLLGPDHYTINILDTPGIEYVFSGSCSGYSFDLKENSVTVVLTGNEDPVTASWSGNRPFIQTEEDLTLVLDCNYVITCPNSEKAIQCSEYPAGGILKLGTTGNMQTLTVITNDDGTWSYGIYGDGNYDAWMYEYTDSHYDNIEAIAVDGFTVSRDGPIDNNDGTYTWIYTVNPNS